jgi:hypothetical protein
MGSKQPRIHSSGVRRLNDAGEFNWWHGLTPLLRKTSPIAKCKHTADGREEPISGLAPVVSMIRNARHISL